MQLPAPSAVLCLVLDVCFPGPQGFENSDAGNVSPPTAFGTSFFCLLETRAQGQVRPPSGLAGGPATPCALRAPLPAPRAPGSCTRVAHKQPASLTVVKTMSAQCGETGYLGLPGGLVEAGRSRFYLSNAVSCEINYFNNGERLGDIFNGGQC